MIKRLGVVLAAVILSHVCPARDTANAASVLYVDPVHGPYVTIQSAIDAAAGGDIIELAPSVYDELAYVGGKDLTIRSAEGRASTIWDGAGEHRMLEIEEADVTLEGISFQNGRVDVLGGGAVRARRARLVIEDCVFRKNEVGGSSSDRTQGGDHLRQRQNQRDPGQQQPFRRKSDGLSEWKGRGHRVHPL